MRREVWILFLALLQPGLAAAQSSANEFLDEKFQFRIGGQAFTKFRSTLRIDSETFGRGTEFSLENDVNVEERVSVARLDGVYRFTDRHSIAFSYYDIDRSGSRALAREIEWNGEVFPISTSVESSFRQRIVKLSYAYTLLTRPRAVMAATAGLHTMQFNASIRALDGSRERSSSADAPLPVFGLRGQYRIANKWRFVGQAEWFDVSTGDFSGTFSDLLLAVEHDTWDRFGFGFGVNSLGLNVSSGDENLKGTIDIKFDSFIVYFKGHLGR